MVDSRIMLFSIMVQRGLPYRRRLHWELWSRLVILIPGISESWPKRSKRRAWYWGQCRRKCSLSSLAKPQVQTGVRQSNACLKRCSFRALNWRRSLVNNLIPKISDMYGGPYGSRQINFVTTIKITFYLYFLFKSSTNWLNRKYRLE